MTLRQPVACVLVAIAFVACPMQAGAVVTYDGTAGVAANIFNSNSQGDPCTGCHSTARTDYDNTATVSTADDRNYAPVGVDFNTYAAATGSDNESRAVTRVTAGTMPPAGALSAGEMSLMSAWQSGGYLQRAAPAVSTAAETGVGPYSVTLNGTVYENGADTTVSFKYSTVQATVDGGGGTALSASSPSGSGGGTSSASFSASIASGLSCSTTYYYRAHGTNAVGSDQGSTGSLSTSACTNITTTSISNKPEATTYTSGAPLATIAATGGDGSYTFSVVAGALPAGLSLNSSTGAIAGTTPNLLTDTTYNFTVRANDGVGPTDDQALSLTITADNDAPVFTSGTGPTSAVEGSAYHYDADDTVNVTEPEGQTLTFSLNAEAIAAGMTINSSSGLIAWTPVNGGPASVNVVVTVTDGTSSPTLSWSITVAATNNPPEITAFAPAPTGTEGVPFSYQVTVTDIDDDAGVAGNIFYQLSGAPAGMSISDLGLITWMPEDAQLTTPGPTTIGPITLTVDDGNEDSSTPTIGNNGVKVFSIVVTSVNEAPVIGAIADQSVMELGTLTLQPSVSDPDDANDGHNLIWSLPAGSPAGMTISNAWGKLGRITYTPGRNTVPAAASYLDVLVTVNVDDGHEDGVTTAAQTFTLRINKLDTDNDLVADYDDNCVNLGNADQADNDGDGVAGAAGGATGGDACDSDDDNDGITDVAELANGLDPLVATDAAGDLDGDGITNLDEFNACGGFDSECLGIMNDTVAPLIYTSGNVEVTATGYYTAVPVSATATDMVFGLPVPATVSVDDDGPYRPGTHVLTWTAADDAGNLATATQTVTVVPTVTPGGTRVVGEGQTASVRVLLNGPSPQYPVTIAYTLSGTAGAADIGIAPTGTLTIASGTEGWISIPVLADAQFEQDESIVVTLLAVTDGKAVLLGSSLSTTIQIVEGAAAPRLSSLWIEQNNEQRAMVYRDGGLVSVNALASDPNGDPLVYDWSMSDLRLAGTAATAYFTFDPASAGLATGSYDVVVRVSDGALVTEQRATIVLAENTPVLAAVDSDGDGINDDVEGGADKDQDGLLDYLDPIDTPEQAALRIDGSDTGLLRLAVAEPGVTLVAGSVALAQQGGGIQVAAERITDGNGDAVVDTGYTHVGAIYDFELRNVPTSGVASVVLPLPVSLPPGAQWRKFINGGWFAFTEGISDALASAVSASGVCPVLDDAAWSAGLLAGSDCVRLTLSDGGPNDADGVVNGVIRDPSAAAVASDAAVSKAPSGETAGNGGLLFLVLLLLAGARIFRRKD
ncbi:MAG: putative Ig domain-containing protein [Pseudomonadota bacterium]